jgi:hypothetical protein
LVETTPLKRSPAAQNRPSESPTVILANRHNWLRDKWNFCTLGGGPMILWWLSFRGGSAVIIEGKSIAHARLLAVVNELGRASHFVEGFPIESELVELIPEDATFRTLPADEARELLKLLRDGSRQRGTRPGHQSRAA